MSSIVVRGAVVSASWLLFACSGTPAPHDASPDAPTDVAQPPRLDATMPDVVQNDVVATDAGSPDGGSADGSSPDVAPRDAAPGDAAHDANAPDATSPGPCGGALFCETFDSYGAMSFHDGQILGPWQAAVTASGASMVLDSTHTVSGPRALHTHIGTGVTGGGRLFSHGTLPILASHPTHLYGRLMMYVDPDGTSVHWSYFGEDGTAYPGSPPAGEYSAFLLSSLLRSGVNRYSLVYNLASTPGHDCNTASTTTIPTARWTCVAFELDSVAHRLRLSLDGGSPILAIDDHGMACTTAALSGDTWYGPALNRFYAGAWSFHAMDAPLDVWVDDVVLDTSPVQCPAH